jgi:hypothetical protein
VDNTRPHTCAFKDDLEYMNAKAFAEHYAPLAVTEKKLVERWKDY